jgi:hypothetical protein
MCSAMAFTNGPSANCDPEAGGPLTLPMPPLALPPALMLLLLLLLLLGGGGTGGSGAGNATGRRSKM